MHIAEILNQVNTFEKNNFLRLIDQIIAAKPTNYKEIEKILSQIDGQIKNADNLSVQNVFQLVDDEFEECIKEEFRNATTQLDIIADILIRDGNSLMSREWLLHLYNREIKSIKNRVKNILDVIQNEETERSKFYSIYQACVVTAYTNDEENNRDKKVTDDEQSILNTLSDQLDLSHEEVKLINYSVVPIEKLDIDDLISYLVKSGIIFYSKKNYQIYVPDEVIKLLRKIRGKEIPNKIYKRVLKELKPSQINLIARKHNIPYKLTHDEKRKQIVDEGIKFSNLLLSTIHKPETTKTDKKKEIVYLIENKLNIDDHIGGASLEDKVANFIAYLNRKDEEDSISISVHGYEKLLLDLKASLKHFENAVRKEFELEEKDNINAENLLLHNLKPLDILYTLSDEQISVFCEAYNISTRGSELRNILDAYRDTQNLYLENYINISNRDLESLRLNQIEIKESEIGIKYEELTKLIFKELNLNVDDKLRKELNSNKDKIDILVSINEDEVIIIECKTKKDRKFSIYSSASRQIKAYKELAEKKGLKVVKTFIVAPSFSEDFINECGLDYELNLSLITSEALVEIHSAFKKSKLTEFPYRILLRDVLIDSDRVVKAITK
jgi:hypothetical protein